MWKQADSWLSVVEAELEWALVAERERCSWVIPIKAALLGFRDGSVLREREEVAKPSMIVPARWLTGCCTARICAWLSLFPPTFRRIP